MNRFGIREICDVVFKPLSSVDIGNQHFDAYQPVLYIDTAKTSSLEGAATTVYAQGGQGNPRLIGWETLHSQRRMVTFFCKNFLNCGKPHSIQWAIRSQDFIY